MLKNTSSQKIAVYAYDITTGGAKTGDAANITVYVNKDWGGVNALTDTSATELSSTNAPGWYTFDVSQSETNADVLHFTGKSVTGSIQVAGQLIATDPPLYTTLSVDASGRVDVIKVAGTTQTARDLGASVLLSSGTGTGQLSISSGVVAADATKINSDATSAANLAKTTKVILRGTVQTSGSSTTLIATSAFDVVGTHTDQFRGRIITFDPATTTLGLRGQATDITSSSIATNPVFTVSALTTTPQTGDTFSVT